MNQVSQVKLSVWITIDITEIDKYKMHLIYIHGGIMVQLHWLRQCKSYDAI